MDYECADGKKEREEEGKDEVWVVGWLACGLSWTGDWRGRQMPANAATPLCKLLHSCQLLLTPLIFEDRKSVV